MNCFNDNNKIHIIANSHGLPTGTIHIEFVSFLPNSLYADGTQRVVQTIDTEIELVQRADDVSTCGSVEMVLHYAIVTSYDIAKVNGYSGTIDEYNEALTLLPQLKSEIDDVAQVAESMDTILSDHEKRIAIAENDVDDLYSRFNSQSGNPSSGCSSAYGQIATEVINGRLYIHNYRYFSESANYIVIFRFTSKKNRLISEERTVKSRGPIKKGWHPMVGCSFAKIDDDGFVMFNEDAHGCMGKYSYDARYAINAKNVGTDKCYVRWGSKKIFVYKESDSNTTQTGEPYYVPVFRKFKFAVAFVDSDIFSNSELDQFGALVSNLAFFSVVFHRDSERFILSK